jgi:hypothetical protein
MPEDKSKYLEFLQAAITRMASNSFVAKGWSVTLATALFAFAAKDGNPRFAAVGILPVVLFWSLDAYYLALERRFRDLYNTAKDVPMGNATSFELTPEALTNGFWFRMLFQPAVALVHAPMLLVAVVLTTLGTFR